MTINVTSKHIAWTAIVLILIGGALYGGYAWGNRDTGDNNATTSDVASADEKSDNTEATSNTETSNNTSQNEAGQTASNEPADPCSQIVFSKGDSESAAGTIYWHSVLTNEGSQACSLSGYPTATVSDDFGNSITATNNPFYDVEQVVIPANGGTARIILGSPNSGVVGPGTICTSASTTVLQLKLPSTDITVNSAFGESVCEGFTVSAIYAGT